MHPFAAALARQQLRGLDALNELVNANVRAMNDRLTKLPGLTEPHCRADQKRVYYNRNMLLVDFKKAGFSRDALVKALKAEGVDVNFWDYPEQHKLKIYSEAKWWHHRADDSRSPCPATPTSTPTTSSCRCSTAKCRADRPVRQGLRKGLGAPRGTREGVGLGHRRAGQGVASE